MAVYKDREKGGFRKSFGIYDTTNENRSARNIVVTLALIVAVLILYVGYRLMRGY